MAKLKFLFSDGMKVFSLKISAMGLKATRQQQQFLIKPALRLGDEDFNYTAF